MCEFCNVFEYWPAAEASRQILQTQHVAVLADKNPIADGHLLIAPLDHYLSIGALPARQLQQLMQVKNQVQQALAQQYHSKIVFFEHGSAACSREGSCIEHAHLHAVPSPLDILDEVGYRTDAHTIPSYAHLRRYGDGGYLFLETLDGQKIVFTPDGVIPSQYFRRLLAKKLGRPGRWDWRDKTYVAETHTSIAALRHSLAQQPGALA